MKKFVLAAIACGFAFPSHAAILSVFGPNSSAGTAPAIIAAPANLADDGPDGAENTGMQGFNEAQGVVLGAPLTIDGGSIAAGTVVDSHMIFLNNAGSSLLEHGFGTAGPVTWTFSGNILGVISGADGKDLEDSDSILGAPGSLYPGAFAARGLEGDPLVGFNDDFYSFSGNVLTVGLRVTEPGDWMRVVTAPAPIPLPAAGWMLLAGLGALGAAARKRRNAAA